MAVKSETLPEATSEVLNSHTGTVIGTGTAGGGHAAGAAFTTVATTAAALAAPRARPAASSSSHRLRRRLAAVPSLAAEGASIVRTDEAGASPRKMAPDPMTEIGSCTTGLGMFGWSLQLCGPTSPLSMPCGSLALWCLAPLCPWRFTPLRWPLCFSLLSLLPCERVAIGSVGFGSSDGDTSDHTALSALASFGVCAASPPRLPLFMLSPWRPSLPRLPCSCVRLW